MDAWYLIPVIGRSMGRVKLKGRRPIIRPTKSSLMGVAIV